MGGEGRGGLIINFIHRLQPPEMLMIFNIKVGGGKSVTQMWAESYLEEKLYLVLGKV